MKIIHYTSFGHSDVIQLSQADVPVPQENEVLIRVKATAINPFDWKIREGYLQQVAPVSLPFIPGEEAAGIVEIVGKGVTRFKKGQKVFATKFGGTYAEYSLFPEDAVALMPNNANMYEAAALAIPLATAYSMLVDHTTPKKGQRILVHGAAGSVGTVVVQMAKSMGLFVIATASGNGIATVSALGADLVIDYKNKNFDEIVKDVDLITDLVGGEGQSKLYKLMVKGGTLLSAVGVPSEELATQYGVTAKFILASHAHIALDYGSKLVEQGKIVANINQVLDLEEAAKAQDIASAGGIRGRIVLNI